MECILYIGCASASDRCENRHEMDSLGLYLSIPFCKSKCTYCNFASGVFPASYHDRYIDRLQQDLIDIRNKASRWKAALPEVIDTI